MRTIMHGGAGDVRGPEGLIVELAERLDGAPG
jgi:hypothetical protein